MTSREAFGQNLRRKRLQRGIALEELSRRTKVSVELWEAMERNDFSRWPAGLAARAYIREYADIVGVDASDTVDEFCRVVPHGDRRAERILRETAGLLRHQLTWRDELPPDLSEVDRRASTTDQASATDEGWNLRPVAAGIDLLIVATMASAIGAVLRSDFWVTLGVIALLYHGVSMSVLGYSVSAWAIDSYVALHGRRRRRDGVRIFRQLALMRPDDQDRQRTK
jgi:transcriptional regulator with XRE-family HTH domain